MAFKYLVRPLCASKYIPSLLPRLVQPYSQHVTKTYENILVELPKPGVGLSMSIICHLSRSSLSSFLLTCQWLSVSLNRPRALNALSSALFLELNDALQNFDNDDNTSAIVLTGSEKAFAGTALPKLT